MPERDWITRAEAESKFVTKDAFEPIKLVVYGFVGLALSAIVVGLLALLKLRP